jgi:hypothetical protein
MKARIKLFLHYMGNGYCYSAAWREADRQRAFRRRHLKR